MKFKKKYFKIEIYEFDNKTFTLLHYSRTKMMVEFHLYKLLRKGIKDDEKFVARKNIRIVVEEITPEIACEIANTEWPNDKWKYIVREGDVVRVEI